MMTLHDLCHCSINNPKLARNDHFTIMTISGHKTTSVSRRYNVFTDHELQDVMWMNDEKIGVHVGVHQLVRLMTDHMSRGVRPKAGSDSFCPTLLRI